MALRKIPIRRAGNRDNLFMGGDRELVMFSGLLAFALVFSAQELRATVVGLAALVRRALRAADHGQGRPPDAPRVPAAPSLQAVLPGAQHAVPGQPTSQGKQYQ
jgi:hypothetical protein